ncbi:hypothetical protein M409DRAFT_61738 [Zasmidium cellare ATCC 36951]|uniref:Uncharacterized protein n=1 Tax=Zasmidium cellare ATCC 36951 TaxID=1080233 RepID=A0A6A6BWL0_ZASCE|nr:uncharacterized protein M409DRAFT_61738 [Zasmidium cellare ATCC 36951]KAF2158350.1 hypothetical protein M409DRAFT_61738 [Zasmidium cellare ATCC 36951]
MKPMPFLKSADLTHQEGVRRVETWRSRGRVSPYFRNNFIQIRARQHTRAEDVRGLDRDRMVFWCIAYPYQWWRPRNQMSGDVFSALLCKARAYEHVAWPAYVAGSIMDLLTEFKDATDVFEFQDLRHQQQRLDENSNRRSCTDTVDTSSDAHPLVDHRPQQVYEVSPWQFAKFLQWTNENEPLHIVVEYGEPTAPPYIVLRGGRISLSYSLSAVLLEYVILAIATAHGLISQFDAKRQTCSLQTGHMAGSGIAAAMGIVILAVGVIVATDFAGFLAAAVVDLLACKNNHVVEPPLMGLLRAHGKSHHVPPRATLLLYAVVITVRL